MCLGIPAQIVALHPDNLATVSVNGVQRDISVELIAADAPVVTGEWVLVHVGFALARIDEAEATATLDQIKKLGQNWTDEWDAFVETDIR
ncbi:MAG: HypC/HybG/HupF family hydrogenase formation chaperone [Cellulomonadaceae bacterium]|jgi:hydrogenase expression/formation protein HypC|nr:HypC/HybG/HupF family hydrogenase formation chaperone [Cellulomonadaceae bacterium]